MPLGQIVYGGEALSVGVEGSTACRIKQILKADYTFDHAANASVNTGTEETITFTGAALGDLVFITPVAGSPDPAGTDIVWNAYVSAANTVKIRFQIGATARDMTSKTWTVVVFDIT